MSFCADTASNLPAGMILATWDETVAPSGLGPLGSPIPGAYAPGH